MKNEAVIDRTFRLLIVEDDKDLGHVLAQYLCARGFAAVHLADPTQAIDRLRNSDFDLCIIDVVMPGLGGFELADRIRTLHPELPFFFLTARHQKSDRLRGLGLGAGDYICKPFDVEELELRIRNFLTRSAPNERPILTIGKLRLDRERFELHGPQGARNLTERELDLLVLLIERTGTVVTRREITKSLWGRSDYFVGRSLDVFVSRLRRYLRDDPSIELRSIRGVGLILDIRSN